MAKETKLSGKPAGIAVKPKGLQTTNAGTLLEIMDRTLVKSYPWLVWVIMAITLLFSLLLYDPKISLSGDDSFYINRASEFIHSFKFPSFQGPLYPMVLGIVVAVFGISLTPLKLVSLLAMLGFIYLTFKTFRDKIPATILVATLALCSINSWLLYYASQTYSEAFYIFIQALLVLVFFRHFIDAESPLTIKADIRRHLLLAVCLLALTLTRSIGYSALFAVGGYFLLKGQWRNLLLFILSFAILFAAFTGLKYAIWQEGGLQFSTQGSGLLNKDYYNPQDGKEDLPGLMKRFLDNSHLYLSKHFLYMTGFRTFAVQMAMIPIVTLLLYILSVGALILTFRKNKYLFFTGLLTGAFLLVTFVALQAKWDQGRLIIPVVSMLIMIMLTILYYGSQIKKLRFLQFVLPLIFAVAFLKTLGSTTQQIKENNKESGRFGGLTPDWKHYLQASEWAAENLPKDAVIACRKPSISFVYGKGRNFFGIMQLPTYDKQAFFEAWKKDPGPYVAFSYADFEGKQLSPILLKTMKENIIAQYFAGDKVFFIDKLSDSLKSITLNEAMKLGIKGHFSPDSLMALTGKDNKASSLYYPDSLLLNLHQNKVSYVLTANLRRNSLVKNGQIINTVERYMAFIEDKYPGIMKKVVQVGSDENEPAAIMEILYEKGKLSSPR